MQRVATRRLIDASATLDPAERALLNLWINRGLGDLELARMTGMEPAAVQHRRERIVLALSEELGLPPADVRASLAAIATAGDRSPPVTREGSPAPGADAPLNGAATNGHPPAERGSRHRPWGWLVPVALAVTGLVVVLIATAGTSPGRHHPQAPAAGSRIAAAGQAPTSTSSASIPASPPSFRPPDAHPRGQRFGSLAHARGTVVVTARHRHLDLKLTVSGLPTPRNGHYEVWLYSSLVDSRPLRRLREEVHHLSVRLPRHAGRYRWIDVSFQPEGMVYHSGESVLRATNPARLSPGRPRRRAVRRRVLHRLRQPR